MWQQPVGFVSRYRHFMQGIFHDREIILRSSKRHYSRHISIAAWQQRLVVFVLTFTFISLSLLYGFSFVRLFVAEHTINTMRENSVVFRDIYHEVQNLYDDIEDVRGFNYNSPETLRVMNDWLNNSKLARLREKIENEIIASERLDQKDEVFLLTRQEMADQINNLESAYEASQRERKTLKASLNSLANTNEELQQAYLDIIDENDGLRDDINGMRQQVFLRRELGENTEQILLNFVTALRSIIGEKLDAGLYDEGDMFAEAQGLIKTIASIQDQQRRVIAREIQRTDYSLTSIGNIIDISGISIKRLTKIGLLPSSGIGGIAHKLDTNEAKSADLLNIDQGKLDYRLNKLEAMQAFVSCMPLTTPIETHRIASGFGFRSNPFTGKGREVHYGLDFSAWYNTPIWATSPGKVVYADRLGAYGNMVEIDHGCGFITRYGHMQSIAVEKGDQVQLRQVIGTVGNTGRSTGPHVHYEIRFQGKPIDPAKLIQAGRHVYKGQR